MSEHAIRLLVLTIVVVAGGAAAVVLFLRHLDGPAAFFTGQLSIALPALIDAAGAAGRARRNGAFRPPPDPPGPWP